jgi:hypothetical protein
MRRFLVVVAMAAVCGGAWAQQSGWPVGPGHTVLTLWPNGVPGPRTATGPELDTSGTTGKLVAGRRVVRLGDVSVPTLTLFSPKGKNVSRSTAPVITTHPRKRSSHPLCSAGATPGGAGAGEHCAVSLVHGARGSADGAVCHRALVDCVCWCA